MRLPRMTTRRLMIVIGLIALVLGLRRQSDLYRRKAGAYALMSFHIGTAVWMDGRYVDKDPAVRARDAWARQMAEKYWRLSDYPWLRAGSDPPPPPEALSGPAATSEPPTREDPPSWSRNLRNPPAWTFLWTWQP